MRQTCRSGRSGFSEPQVHPPSARTKTATYGRRWLEKIAQLARSSSHRAASGRAFCGEIGGGLQTQVELAGVILRRHEEEQKRRTIVVALGTWLIQGQSHCYWSLGGPTGCRDWARQTSVPSYQRVALISRMAN